MLAILPFLLTAAVQEPFSAQMPKADLGVTEFLRAHPEYDGRGIRVAILDTGIDPGHPFLQRTSLGGRKIVDWYDATTDGRLSIQHRVTVDGPSLIGLSGRKIDLGQHYVPGATYGLIRLDQDWLPDNLEARIQSDRRDDWSQEKRQHADANALADDDASVDLAASERAYRFEEYRDHGPVWDVLVFEKGGERMIVIDQDQDGILDEEPALRSYRESGDWSTLGDEALLNYAVGFESEDEIVLYFDAHGHGTHVAGIVGAFEGSDARLNGIAPGVELVSIKIGDGKFGGSTSGFAISKALDYAVESGCQIVNMSFGGPSFAADGEEPDGWAVEEATRRGLCVVTSAGNEGPTLTTVGAPATTTAAFSIAAAIWPDTARSNYSSLDPSEAVLFDFSSRGPLPNGSLGIDYAAPGAALAPLPSWGMVKGENWNGTSMAAPQMAGCIALLHSAARAEGLPRTPASIDRALRLSAQPLAEHAWVEHGHGFIQMLGALSGLRVLKEHGHVDQEYRILANNPFGEGGGVYLRGVASPRPREVQVAISPTFSEDAPNALRANFLRSFRPVAEADWVSVPDGFYMNSAGSRIPVRVSPGALPVGLHSTRVLIYDVDQPQELGPEIIVPVTIIVAERTDSADEHRWAKNFSLAPGDLERSFLEVPLGANLAKLRVVQTGGGRNEIRAGAGSVSGTRYSGDRQARGRYFLESGEVYETTVPVEAGTVFEYTMASRWATNTSANYRLEVQFVGVQPQLAELVIPAGQDLGYMAWQSHLDDAQVDVEARVAGYAMPIHADLELHPDPIRHELIMGQRMFWAKRQFEVQVPEGGCELVLRMPHSIQTTELREDLMLVITDAKGQVVHRHIAYEIDTELGDFAAGDYQFELIYPGLGAAMLQTAYAGAELRFLTGGSSCSISTSLADAVSGDYGSRLNIPYFGSRLSVVHAPELAALPDGQYWFGTISARAEGMNYGSAEMRIERPALQQAPSTAIAAATPAHTPVADGDASLASMDHDDEELSPAEEARQAYEEACSAGDSAEAVRLRIAAARHWASTAPHAAQAELAIYDSLVAADLQQRARQLATRFLTRFPREIQAFLSAAPSWN